MTAPVFPVVDAERVTPLPLEQRGYYDFYRTPRWRGWKPILGLLMGAFFALIAMTVPAVIGMALYTSNKSGISLGQIQRHPRSSFIECRTLQ